MDEFQSVDRVVPDKEVTNKLFIEGIRPIDRERIKYIATIPQYIKWISEEYKGKLALSDETKKLSYTDLLSRIKRKIHWLNRQGIDKGANIAILSNNSIDAIEWFLAIPSAGYVVVMLPTALAGKLLSTMSVKLKLKLILTTSEFIEGTKGTSCNVEKISSMDDEEGEMVDTKKEDLAAIFLTSGTTGIPKGVMLNHGAIMRGAFNGTFMPGKLDDLRTICLLPMYHVYGITCAVLFPLYKGAEIYVCDNTKAGIMKVPIVKPTFLSAVPAMLDVILKLGIAKGKAYLCDLKVITVGGAAMAALHQKMMNQLNLVLGYGYGLTETAGAILMHDVNVDSASICGVVFPEQEAKLVNGELWIRGDAVMMGYYDDPEATSQVMENGWFKTGDIFRMMEKGELNMIGRIKNLIILDNGENVSPEEIEDLFDASPLVKECLVSEAKMNGNPVIGIEIFPEMSMFRNMDEAELKMKELVAEINRDLPSYKHVLKLTLREEPFEKQASMKIKRK